MELSYVLPREESSKFESLFSYLEKHKHDLGISSYGASVTTLEEVFLKVKEDEDSDSEPLSKKLYRQLSSKSRRKFRQVDVHFWIALTEKCNKCFCRFNVSKRVTKPRGCEGTCL